MLNIDDVGCLESLLCYIKTIDKETERDQVIDELIANTKAEKGYYRIMCNKYRHEIMKNAWKKLN